MLLKSKSCELSENRTNCCTSHRMKNLEPKPADSQSTAENIFQPLVVSASDEEIPARQAWKDWTDAIERPRREAERREQQRIRWREMSLLLANAAIQEVWPFSLAQTTQPAQELYGMAQQQQGGFFGSLLGGPLGGWI